MSAPVSSADAEHYTWGDNCDGWHLVRTRELSVIQERMPPGAGEVRHLHQNARQFFFVLNGEAVLEADGIEYRLGSQHGLEISPGTPHRIFNRHASDLHFLVISQPSGHGDRIIAANI